MVEPTASAGNRPPHLDENIDSLLTVQKREREQRPPAQGFMDRVSRIGRPGYLLVLLGFVIAWVAAHAWLSQAGSVAFDPFPYALLDGILTLAALISTTVVLIAQNRLTRIEQ